MNLIKDCEDTFKIMILDLTQGTESQVQSPSKPLILKWISTSAIDLALNEY